MSSIKNVCEIVPNGTNLLLINFFVVYLLPIKRNNKYS